MTHNKFTAGGWISLPIYKTKINGHMHSVIEIVAPHAKNKKDYSSLGISVVLLPEGEYNKQEKLEATANAHLIAAAPDLLEALEKVRANFPDEPCEIKQQRSLYLVKLMDSAIKKAKGL